MFHSRTLDREVEARAARTQPPFLRRHRAKGTHLVGEPCGRATRSGRGKMGGSGTTARFSCETNFLSAPFWQSVAMLRCTWLLLVCSCVQSLHAPHRSRRAVLARAAALIPIVAAPKVALALAESLRAPGFVGYDVADAKQLADSTAPPANLNGRYSDPKHPGCARKVSKSGKFVTISGTDEDGKKWTVQGKTNGRDLRIDFSSRGGPPDMLARADSVQIKFADGDVWKKL